MHKRNVTKWLVDYLKRNNIDSTLEETLSHELSILEVKNQDGLEIKQADPEYIFKTFVRTGPELSSIEWCYVTLLEENRDIIGHGTTGLTSWQGALFLADWCQTQQDKLEGKHILELGAGVGMLGINSNCNHRKI
jgi:predicted nicotinamide N-methyase